MTGEQSEMWRIADDVAWTASGNDVVALDLVALDAHPMTLQETAAYVWEELAASGPITADALVRTVADAYAVGEEIVRDDVLRLLAQLQAQHLVTV